MPDVAEPLLTTAELAKRLSVSPSIIREWTKRGVIPEIVISHNVGRFGVADVMNALWERSTIVGGER